MTPSRAMILAAGFGTRMGALTADRPKPLLPVAGRALIDHTLDRVAEAGVTDAVVNLHYLGDQIRAHLASRTAPRIRFSEELEEILDTGGGFVAARRMLGEDPVYTVNSDSIWSGPPPLPVLAKAWEQAGAQVDALLLLVPSERAVGYTRAGDFHLEPTLRRRGDAARAPFVYTGAQIIRPRAFDDPPPGAFSTNVIWNRLLSSGRIAAALYPGFWVDVGTPEGLHLAGEVLTRSVPG